MATATMDDLSDDALSLAMELRRLGVGLCADLRQPRRDPDPRAMITPWVKRRAVRLYLRSTFPSVCAPHGRLFVTSGIDQLTDDHWSRLRRHAAELFPVIG